VSISFAVTPANRSSDLLSVSLHSRASNSRVISEGGNEFQQLLRDPGSSRADPEVLALPAKDSNGGNLNPGGQKRKTIVIVSKRLQPNYVNTGPGAWWSNNAITRNNVRLFIVCPCLSARFLRARTQVRNPAHVGPHAGKLGRRGRSKCFIVEREGREGGRVSVAYLIRGSLTFGRGRARNRQKTLLCSNAADIYARATITVCINYFLKRERERERERQRADNARNVPHTERDNARDSASRSGRSSLAQSRRRPRTFRGLPATCPPLPPLLRRNAKRPCQSRNIRPVFQGRARSHSEMGSLNRDMHRA